MAQAPTSDIELQKTIDAVRTHGNVEKAALALKMPYSTIQHRVTAAGKRGLKPRGVAPDDPLLLKSTIKNLESELKKAQKESADAAAIKHVIGALRENVEAYI